MTPLAENAMIGFFGSSLLLVTLSRNSEAYPNMNALSKNNAVECIERENIRDYPIKTLVKRSTVVSQAALKGLRAAKYLLKGSKPVGRADKLYDETINEFRKAGGYQQAAADFRTIKPINIKESGSKGQTITAGRVGDRFIIIRPEGFFETTIVEIVKWHGTSKQHVDLIYYY